jgi:hypothetical protein
MTVIPLTREGAHTRLHRYFQSANTEPVSPFAERTEIIDLDGWLRLRMCGALLVREGTSASSSALVLLNSEATSKQIVAHRNAHQDRGPDHAECGQLTNLTIFPELVNGN